MAEQRTCDGCAADLYDCPNDDVSEVELCDECARRWHQPALVTDEGDQPDVSNEQGNAGGYFMGIGTQCRECGQFILATPAEAVAHALCQDCEMNQREQGNDTAAAFQVGDRVVRVGDTVRYQCDCGYQHEYAGEVTAIRDGDRLTIHTHDGADIERRASAVEIIARPAPAPAPAQPDGQWVLDLARGMGVPMDQDDVAPPADSEPATPAPEQTAAAVDVAGIPRSVTDALIAIDHAAHLSTDQTEDVVCRALNQIGVALIELFDAIHALADSPKS